MLVCTGMGFFFLLTGRGRVGHVVSFFGGCGFCLCFTCSIVQKMWASSCWKRLTRVKPLRVPESSFRWRTPKSASLRGNSLQDRGRWANIKLERTRKNIPFIRLREDLRQHRNKTYVSTDRNHILKFLFIQKKHSESNNQNWFTSTFLRYTTSDVYL